MIALLLQLQLSCCVDFKGLYLLHLICCYSQDLESQLVAASEEKTKVQSKFHELSIKHRQLIETSPQVATIWNEVLVQQAQAHGDAAAEQRLRNFDLRHTGAHSGLSMSVGQGRGLAAATGEVSPRKLLGVNAAAAIFSGGIMPQGKLANCIAVCCQPWAGLVACCRVCLWSIDHVVNLCS